MAASFASRDTEVIREALVRRGIPEGKAASIVAGLTFLSVLLDSLTPEDIEQIKKLAFQRGLDIVAGDDWALLSGSESRLAALTRSAGSGLSLRVVEQLAAFLQQDRTSTNLWHTSRGPISIGKPFVVGILNVTPDSFSDGGKYLNSEAAVAHAADMIESGADMIDVGGESTRPGAQAAVTAEEEWERVCPLLRALAREFADIPVSVDTVKSTVAERAIGEGAAVINDVSALRLDPRVAEVCAETGAGLILNHSRGPFEEMASYEHANYEDVVSEAVDELLVAVGQAEAAGMRRHQLVLDPGLGFAKTPEQNCRLLRGLSGLVSVGMPVMVGPSRKRFLGTLTGKEVADRDTATAAACIAALFGGAYLFRVHAVGLVRESLAIADALRNA